MPITRIV